MEGKIITLKDDRNGTSYFNSDSLQYVTKSERDGIFLIEIGLVGNDLLLGYYANPDRDETMVILDKILRGEYG